MKKMRAHINRITIVLLLALVCIFLPGCIPDYCDKEYRKEIEEQGRARIEEYLNQKVSEGEMPGYELTQVSMHNGQVEGVMGNFASPLVRGRFVTNNHEFIIDVDVSNSDVYWNYNEKDISDAMTECLLPEMEMTGVDIPAVFGQLETERVIVGHDMKNSYQDAPIDTYVYVNNVYPALSHGETKENAAEFLKNGEGAYSLEFYFDAETNQAADAALFENLCDANPRISYIMAYNVSDYSYMFAQKYGYINDDFMMTAKEKYVYNPAKKELEYSRYDVYEVNGTCVNYVDYKSDIGGEHNYRPPLACDVENSRVFYLRDTGENGAYLFFNQEPKSNEADTYYYNYKKKKYKKLNHYDIIQYPSGVYSLYREDDFNHGRSGYLFYSEYMLKLKK